MHGAPTDDGSAFCGCASASTRNEVAYECIPSEVGGTLSLVDWQVDSVHA